MQILAALKESQCLGKLHILVRLLCKRFSNRFGWFLEQECFRKSYSLSQRKVAALDSKHGFAIFVGMNMSGSSYVLFKLHTMLVCSHSFEAEAYFRPRSKRRTRFKERCNQP